MVLCSAFCNIFRLYIRFSVQFSIIYLRQWITRNLNSLFSFVVYTDYSLFRRFVILPVCKFRCFEFYIYAICRFVLNSAICPRSLDPFYIVSFYIKWVKTSWTYTTCQGGSNSAANPSAVELSSFPCCLQVTIGILPSVPIYIPCCVRA